MKRLFLDANVLFTAAHNPQGKAALLIGLGEQRYWTLITSQLACEEARRNIALKFPDCLTRLEELLRYVSIVRLGSQASCPLDLPAKDQPIFLAALEVNATHLLTGDRTHFGRFMNKPSETKDIVIQTVSHFLLSMIKE